MTHQQPMGPLITVKNRKGGEIKCILEHTIPLDGNDYLLLTPVDLPVCLVRMSKGEGDKDEIIEDVEGAEDILCVADSALAGYGLALVRSAVTLTVSGELEEPDADEIDEEMEEGMDDGEEESDLYQLLIPFRADGQEYGLYIPLDPFFVVARMEGTEALVVEGKEMERIRARLEERLSEIERIDSDAAI